MRNLLTHKRFRINIICRQQGSAPYRVIEEQEQKLLNCIDDYDNEEYNEDVTWNQQIMFENGTEHFIGNDIEIEKTYCLLQEKCYNVTFGLENLAARNLHDFHTNCTKLDYSNFLKMQLYIYCFNNCISSRGCRDLIGLINTQKGMFRITNKIKFTQNEDMLKLNIINMLLHYMRYMCYINYGNNMYSDNK